MWGEEALRKAMALDPATALDIGSGDGKHAAIMRRNGISVTTVDNNKQADIRGTYPACAFLKTYDLVWCCHCLEHTPNVGAFLQAMIGNTAEGGHIAITVPPLKEDLVAGHLTLWTAPILVYNLVWAGLDCSEAMVGMYGYNISVIVRKKLIAGHFDRLDIRALSPYFPWEVKQGSRGLGSVNWGRSEGDGLEMKQGTGKAEGRAGAGDAPTSGRSDFKTQGEGVNRPAWKVVKEREGRA